MINKTTLFILTVYSVCEMSCVAPKSRPQYKAPEGKQTEEVPIKEEDGKKDPDSSKTAIPGSEVPKSIVKGKTVPVPAIGIGANAFHAKGEYLLDKIISNFRVDNLRLYAEAIDKNNKKIDGYNGASFLWPGSHVVRAFRAASMINPSKYLSELRSYSTALQQYNHGNKLTASLDASSDPYFDDNAIIGESLIDAALRTGSDPKMLEIAQVGLNFCFAARDSNWGVPQLPKQIGWGMFYSQATILPALGAAKYSFLTSDSNYLNIATEYYAISKKETTGLINPEGLYNQFSFIVSGKVEPTTANDRTLNGSGLRAYQSTSMAQLALTLSKAKQDSKYLKEAQDLAGLILKHWYKPGQGLNEISYWGGSDTVEMLLDLYEVDQDPKWKDIARDIVKDLIARGEDKRGFYASSAEADTGNWNVDRRQMNPDRVDLMGQAAAATAFLRMAHCDVYCPAKISEGKYIVRNALTGRVLTFKEGGVISSENSASPEQIWELKRQNDGTYSFKATSQSSVLGAAEIPAKDGTKLASNAGALDDNSKFILVDRGDSLFRIVNKGSKKSLDGGKDTAEDSVSYLWAVADVPNQFWTIELQN